jgi:glutathione peroxidase
MICLASLLITLLLPLGASAEGHGPLAPSLLDLEARRLSGEVQPLSVYRGQVLLVVNTASRCGYTPQYQGLQSLFERYRERGFSVLGFPSNDFGGQEPGSADQIDAFCRANYGVEFPMFSKVTTRGEGQHAVYRYLTSQPVPVGGPIRWNFQKYLVDRTGRVVSRHASGVRPDSDALVAEIERLLADPDLGG